MEKGSKLRLLLWTLSGEDDYIIRRCNNSIQWAFALIGIWVIVIMSLCGISTYLFFDTIFHSVSMGIVISIIWVLMLFNLYLLVLYTISPTILPSKSKAGSKSLEIQHVKIETGALVSLIGRLLFLALIAIVMAQPLIFWLFDNLANHPQGWSQHYLSNIRLLSSMAVPWMITIVFILMFCYPVFVKFSVRKDTTFYEIKQEIEKEMILKHYGDFKIAYSNILSEKIKHFNSVTQSNLSTVIQQLQQAKLVPPSFELPLASISYYESHVDPPFNSEKIKDSKNTSSEQELLEFLYNKND